MSDVTVRIPKETHSVLKQMAEERKESVSQVIVALVTTRKRKQESEEQFWVALEEAAKKEAERKQRWQHAKEAYASLAGNPEAFADFQDEMEIWDGTLMDGLHDLDDDYSRDKKPTTSPLPADPE